MTDQPCDDVPGSPGDDPADGTPLPPVRLELEPRVPERLDRLLVAHFSGTTRETIKRWILDGRVTVDGRATRPKERIAARVVVEVRPASPPPTAATPDPSVVFGVVYEDSDLLVVDKPAGLVVHPGRGHPTGTLVNGLLARSGFERLPADPRDPEGQLRPGIVHRIDKETSGLLVVAKTELAREGLKAQLAAHSVERAYLALCHGVPRPGRIATLHGRDPTSRLRFSSRIEQGRAAVTHVSVLEKLWADRVAFLRLELETGRTHQIRVHLSEQAKTPLLADALYGGFRGDPGLVALERALGRHALHATVLGFSHPRSGKRLVFQVPLPEDMTRAREALRLGPGGREPNLRPARGRPEG